MDKSFFTSREIYVRLASKWRDRMTSFDPYTIMRWCSEVVTDFIKDPSGTVSVTIEYGKPSSNTLDLQQSIARINKVYDADSKELIPYSHQGDRLLFSSSDANRNINIDCQVYLMDEDGFPYLPRGYEKACEAYCEYNMFRPDFMDGRINQAQWAEITQTKDWEIEAAARAWDEMNENAIKELQSVLVHPGYKRFQ